MLVEDFDSKHRNPNQPEKTNTHTSDWKEECLKNLIGSEKVTETEIDKKPWKCDHHRTIDYIHLPGAYI